VRDKARDESLYV